MYLDKKYFLEMVYNVYVNCITLSVISSQSLLISNILDNM